MTDRIHAILSEEWRPLEVVLAKGEQVLDGGYQEEIDRLQADLASLDDAPSK